MRTAPTLLRRLACAVSHRTSGPGSKRLADKAFIRNQIQALVRDQRTMVLATCDNQAPWAAPVYFVYHDKTFFFYSSSRSLHIRQSAPDGLLAAAIFFDSEHWQDIRGIQMTGRIRAVQKKRTKAGATARYLIKFPFAGDILKDKGLPSPNATGHVGLYGFTPLKAFVVNNAVAFGQRLAFDPATFDLLE